MINKLTQGIKPVALVSKETMSQIFDLSHTVSPASKDSKPSIKVSLRDGQSYSTNNFDDLFNVPNKSSNPIKTIEISNGSYSKRYISVVTGGQWHSSSGAELTVHGDPEYTQSVARKFNEILKIEKSIFETIISIQPTYIGFIFTTIFLMLILMLNRNLNALHILDTDLFSIWTIFPLIFLTFSSGHAWIQSNVIGKSVFLWGEGEKRYRKTSKLIIYAFWILPTTILLGLLTNKIS